MITKGTLAYNLVSLIKNHTDYEVYEHETYSGWEIIIRSKDQKFTLTIDETWIESS
jgi:hypothetical protein